tara:strand:- start:100 stop:387 length:288 start_codon:yes stop_codon:yes gene_type:complete
MAGKANVSIEGRLIKGKKGEYGRYAANWRGAVILPTSRRNINKEKDLNLRGRHSDPIANTLERLKIPKKKKKGVGSDHFTKLTKKKKVRKGPISR